MEHHKKRGDIDKIATWTKHEPWLCETCKANCCYMQIELTIRDMLRMEIVTKAELRTPIEALGKRLKQEGVIEHLFVKERIFILAQTAEKVCPYLDPASCKCRIYKKRPEICRDYPSIGGARPGFCPYEEK